jgi:hypothetical protein
VNAKASGEYGLTRGETPGGTSMKPVKMLGLAILLSLIVTACVGANSATAAEVLCSQDESPCAIGNRVTNLHILTLPGSKAKILTNIINVECAALFSGEGLFHFSYAWGLILVHIVTTYSNCNSGCTVEEVGEEMFMEISTEGIEKTETGSVALEGEVEVVCSGINCVYDSEGLLGTAKGALASAETNGEITIKEQTLKKVSGLFCPSTTKLDLTITPLSAVYIT